MSLSPRQIPNFFFRTLCLVALACLSASSQTAIAQTPPAITNFAPDDVVFCIALTGEAKANEKGAGFERWLAQPEIRDSYLNILDLIKEQVEANEPTMAGLVDWLPQLVLGNPWIMYVDDPDLEKPKFKFVVQLGEFEKKVQDALIELNAKAEQEIEEFEISGSKFFRTVDSETSTEYGFYENHLLLANGNGELEKLVKRFNSSQPKWVDAIKAELPLERTAAIFLIDVKRLIERNAEPMKEGTLAQVLRFDEIEKIVGVMGFDADESVNRVSVHCPKKLEGLLKTFDVEPLKKEDYRGVSDSVHSLSSFKLNASVLWELLLKSEDSRPDLESFQESMKENFKIDFEKDILGNLGGHVYSYQQFSLLNPQSNALLGIEIRDPDAFKERMDEFVTSWEGTNDSFGFDVDETKNGKLYQLVPFEPEMQTFFPGVSFQVVDKELLIALDSKAINSHIRKSGRDGGKLTDDLRVAQIFDARQNGNLGMPIAVFYLDVNVLIESIYSVMPMVLSQFDQMGGGIGFDMEMLPPMEKAMNGVLPDIFAVYRTEKGFQLVERSTLPGLSATAGIGVALALPAVAQVRSAARKVTSQNNLRQLGIAAHNYESANKALPPSYRTKGEKRLLSWRVEILPYVDQGELYEKFKHDEPWDSPHNKALIKEMPTVFAHPGLDLEPGKTVYLGVAGKNSVFVPAENAKGRSFRDITDGTSNTVMMVEANRDQAVYWTQPDDFNVDELDDPVAALRGNWPGDEFIVVMADCSLQTMNVSNEVFKQMSTVNGGEAVEDWQDD